MTYMNSILKEQKQEADIADFKVYLWNYGSQLSQEAQQTLIESVSQNDKISMKSLHQLVDLYNFIPVSIPSDKNQSQNLYLALSSGTKD